MCFSSVNSTNFTKFLDAFIKFLYHKIGKKKKKNSAWVGRHGKMLNTKLSILMLCLLHFKASSINFIQITVSSQACTFEHCLLCAWTCGLSFWSFIYHFCVGAFSWINFGRDSWTLSYRISITSNFNFLFTLCFHISGFLPDLAESSYGWLLHWLHHKQNL
jgi:hypothetical protein